MSNDIEKIRKALRGKKSFKTLLCKVLGDETPPMKSGKLGPLVAVAKTDPGREYLLKHEKPEVRQLMEAKVAVSTWKQHQKRVEGMVRQAGACDGFMPVGLKYYGAHTGRFSGDEGVNLQNLTARSPHACINAVRSLLTAPEGHVLVITDLAQVEARNLAWEAGQDDLVAAFAEGRDVYCEFASEVMGKKIRKPRSIDPPQVAKYLTHYRMLGKVGVLGCFTKDTLVLTNRGWIPIIEVKSSDKVWDGETWVATSGPIYQGRKSILHWKGIGVTPDHQILTHEGWVSAFQVAQGNTRYLKSAKFAGNLKSLGMCSVLVAELKRWRLCVWNAAAISTQWIHTILQVAKVHDVVSVRKKPVVVGLKNTGDTLRFSQTTTIEPDFLIESLRSFLAAVIPRTSTGNIMAGVGSLSIKPGLKTGPRCSNTSSRWKGGIIRIWNWIESTTTKGISRVIYGFVPEKKISTIGEPSHNCKKKLHVYDLGFCGSKNRFTILTTAGPMLVHNCGYGMGVDRFLTYARDIYHLNIDRATAERFVKHYREKNKAIVKFWGDLNRAMIYVTRYPSETCEMDRGLTFRNEDNTIILGLPSDRALYYYQPSIIKNEWGYDQVRIPDERKIGSYVSLYGGYICENVIQATSRDILGDSILDLEERGWPCALHSHDEVVLVVPEDQGEKALADSIRVMSTTPSWMTGCPLGAEGKIVREYCK